MVRLMLGNIEPGTSDDEIQESLVKYGFPSVRCDRARHRGWVAARDSADLQFAQSGDSGQIAAPRP